MSEHESQSWKRIARVYAHANREMRSRIIEIIRSFQWVTENNDPEVKQLIFELLNLTVTNHDLEDNVIGVGEKRREVYENHWSNTE